MVNNHYLYTICFTQENVILKGVAWTPQTADAVWSFPFVLPLIDHGRSLLLSVHSPAPCDISRCLFAGLPVSLPTLFSLSLLPLAVAPAACEGLLGPAVAREARSSAVAAVVLGVVVVVVVAEHPPALFVQESDNQKTIKL